METRKPLRRPAAETAVGFCVLILLGVIAGSIYRVQFTFNPAVLTARELQPDTAPADRVPPLVTPPEGLAVMSAPERFDAQRLADKIDGKAEFYLSAGFQALETQRFRLAGDPAGWLELFVYHMGSGENAYAVFSGQRRDDARSLDLTRYAYRTANALFLVHGAYYLEIVASRPLDAFGGAAERLARHFIDAIPVAAPAPADADLLPSEDQIPQNVTLLAENAFGFDRLDRVYIAHYRLDGAEIAAFVSRRSSPAEARELAGAYADFLVRFGGREMAPEIAPDSARLMELFGAYELVFSHRTLLAGVHEAPSAGQARELAGRLYRALARRTD